MQSAKVILTVVLYLMFSVVMSSVSFVLVYLQFLFCSDRFGIVPFHGWMLIIRHFSSMFRLEKLLTDLMIPWRVLFLMEYNMIMVSIFLMTLNLI